METYLISEEDYRLLDLTSSPYKYDDMPVSARELFLMMYSLYSNYLTQYILRKTSLGSFDQEVGKYKEFAEPVSERNKDTYQLLAGDMLNYFYVRNNLYLHRLSSEEMNALIGKIQSKNFSYDPFVESFIESTYKKVIAEDVKDKNSLVNFGPIHEKFFASPSDLIIGFRCEDTLDYDHICKQREVIGELPQKMSLRLTEELGHGVTVLKYDRMSIKKKVFEGRQM